MVLQDKINLFELYQVLLGLAHIALTKNTLRSSEKIRRISIVSIFCLLGIFILDGYPAYASESLNEPPKTEWVHEGEIGEHTIQLDLNDLLILASIPEVLDRSHVTSLQVLHSKSSERIVKIQKDSFYTIKRTITLVNLLSNSRLIPSDSAESTNHFT